MTRTTQTAPTIPSSGVIAGGASTSFSFDATACVFASLYLKNTAGATVGTTAGVSVTVKRGVGSSPDYVTQGFNAGTIPSVATAAKSIDVDLTPGPYTITLLNLDSANSVTVAAELDFYT